MRSATARSISPCGTGTVMRMSLQPSASLSRWRRSLNGLPSYARIVSKTESP